MLGDLRMSVSAEEERRKRIQVAMWAYAYEFEADSLVPDAVFDKVSHSIDTSIDTGNERLDTWFKKYFVPDTGQWIRLHPDLHIIRDKYYKYFYNRKD